MSAGHPVGIDVAAITSGTPLPPPSPAEERARELLRSLGSVVVAFSGGVDSSAVLGLAVAELGAEHVLAVTSRSETYSPEELETAGRVAASLGVAHRVIETSELEIPGFAANPPDRCYHCKGELFRELGALVRAEGYRAVVDGANHDDRGDFRPGIRAADELGVRHPLMEAGLGKEEVRTLARRLGLSNWSKPAMACLSSRFPYGEEITREKLAMVARAESFLRDRGFAQLRVRHHGTLARVEVPADELARLVSVPALREELVGEFKRIGYHYVTLDLQGFRSGSMNEVLEGEWR